MVDIQRKGFISKLEKILLSCQFQDVIWYIGQGRFCIPDRQQFQIKILPIISKKVQYKSFIRQLHMYNFKKVKGSSILSFENKDFLIENQFYNIKRKLERKGASISSQPSKESSVAMDEGNRRGTDLKYPNHIMVTMWC